ncbi:MULTISPECIES: hypothetical protein [unclassified Yoonia]|uniref:hypothetical protein n=1 Tax=unclassified Yoonia TaxID=2629118 RepID=UPI002AFE70FD|nr:MULTISPECIES: hypothetical protein [unclassified Yoonia]
MRALFTPAVALAVVGSPVQALSCLPTDAVTTFSAMTAESEGFILLHGTLDFDTSTLPAFIETEPTPAPAPIDATFTGTELITTGESAVMTIPATLQITCAGPWCGTASSGQEAVIFAAGDTDAIDVFVGPCGGQVFYDPTPEMIAALTTCLQDGACSAEHLQQTD